MAGTNECGHGSFTSLTEWSVEPCRTLSTLSLRIPYKAKVTKTRSIATDATGAASRPTAVRSTGDASRAEMRRCALRAVRSCPLGLTTTRFGGIASPAAAAVARADETAQHRTRGPTTGIIVAWLTVLTRGSDPKSCHSITHAIAFPCATARTVAGTGNKRICCGGGGEAYWAEGLTVRS